MKNLKVFGLFTLIASQLFIASCTYDEETPDITITANDVTLTVAENPSQGRSIGAVTGSVNTGDPITFSITSQSVQDALAIDSQNGDLTVNSPLAFDFETNPVISATVMLTSGSESTTVNVTITVTDVDEGALTASGLNVTLREQPANGDVLGSIQATTTNGENITFEVTFESPEGAINVGQTTGEVTVADAALFDVVASTQFSATVNVMAGEASQEVAIVITVEPEPNFTIWDGPDVTFTKADGADPATAQDRITDNVIITRGNSGGQIFNIAVESSATQSSSPAGTEWAEGVVSNIANMNFQPFRAAVGRPKDVVGKNLVLHLIEDDIYIPIRFTAWSERRGGGFSYVRASE
ncbi:MAG: cadherin repeat domain-containing protein [Bacteroidota bacterium]